jgi:hypothetical protein
MRIATNQIVRFAAAFAFTATAAALELPQEKGPERTVAMFDFFCLSQLPDLDAITKAAGFGEFAQITGQELEQYQPAVPPEKLYAWSFHDHGAKLVLTASQAKPDEEFKKAAPAFAKSTNVACSLLVPTEASQDALLATLVARLQRQPDEMWDEGPMRVHAWSGQNDKHFSHVHYYAPLQGGGLSVISASTFVKD